MTDVTTAVYRATVARLYQIATDYAGGFGEGLGRAEALARLAAVSIDPELLSEAAAAHALADNWYAIAAVNLLLDAGAEQHLLEHHIHELGPGEHYEGGHYE
ncbi:hypothetical protein WEI85_37075 [Actinomycetes bacterium KLBMP 9797]